ncbi:MAG: aldehyde reductase, partial [Proteobacteria bacterium]|nr:aldehyde reductase [Pseudomonadota bacterium]
GDWTADETVWTDPDVPGVSAYARSKTLAERAAWETIHAQTGDTQLATVNPALVLGPVMSRDFSESVQVVERLLSGRVPGLPRLGFNVVDVRDVAELHVRAMIDVNSAGERYIAAGTYAWMADLAELLRARVTGPQRAKIPTRKMPDFVIRLAGLFDKDLGSVTPGLGQKHDYSAEKAKRMLAWRSRPMDETIMDTAGSLIAAGVV